MFQKSQRYKILLLTILVLLVTLINFDMAPWINVIFSILQPRDNFVIGESYSVGQRSQGSSSAAVGGAYQGRSSRPSGGSGNPFVIGSR